MATNPHYYPGPEEVFRPGQHHLSEYLIPAALVDHHSDQLGRSVRLPIVIPIEPHDSFIGQNTSDYHARYCHFNWIGYKIIDGKLELLSDTRFFLLEYLRDRGESLDYLDKHYTAMHACHKECVASFRERGFIPENWWSRNTSGYNTPFSPAFKSADYPSGGNWSIYDNDIKVLKKPGGEYGDRYIPMTSDGREFEYVGYFSGSTFIRDSNIDMPVFIDPIESIMLCTFDW